ncbi:MAG: gliding motility-associated C-terminal domain-containing protein, partial [Chitinophagales bacterium]|nr:gliding motility-associated C-terminal domain-containing protein [Chitinophagales bacterium]
TWSVTPANAGTTDATGNFTSNSSFVGNATITYTDNSTGQACSGAIVVTVSEPISAGQDATAVVCNNTNNGNVTTIDLNTLVTVGGGSFSPIGTAPALSGTTFNGNGLTAGVYEYTYTINGNVACPAASITISITVDACSFCPSVTVPLDATMSLCDGKDPGLSEWEGQIQFSGNSATFAGFAWFSDAAMSIPVQESDYDYTGDGCNTQATTLYVGILCTLTPNEPIAAGSLDLLLLPPYDTTLLVSTSAPCTVPTLTSTCDNYIITADDVPTEVLPGDEGVAFWTITYNEPTGTANCFAEPLEIAYSCPLNCPTATFTATPLAVCVGDSFTLTYTGTASAAATYQWTVGTQVLTGVGPHTVTPTSPGILIVNLAVTDNGCTESSNAVVTVSEVSISLSTNSTMIEYGNSAILTAEAVSTPISAISYEWSPSGLDCNDVACSAVTVTPISNTSYSVTATSASGCSASAQIAITVHREAILVVPNAFSPNGDNTNDIWQPLIMDAGEIYITVYNRWGEKVFETANAQEGWDGFFRDIKQELGVYVYYIEYTEVDSTERKFVKGNLTLLR